MPADTKVAEWINDEAGTGASIESGNHKWPIICADFILLQKIKQIALNFSNKPLLLVFIEIKFNNVSILFTLYTFHKTQKDINKNTSLILLKVNALKLQLNVVILNFQKLINKKDVNPINSQPIIMVKKLLPITKNIIEKINQLINKTKFSPLSSNLK